MAIDGEMLDVTRVDPTMAGAGGGHAMISTSANLTRFHQRLRAGSLFQHQSTVDQMFAFQPAIDPELPAAVGYGLGVCQLEHEGMVATGHMGGTAGYQSFMLYLPATDRYVSGFINTLGDIGAVPVLERANLP